MKKASFLLLAITLTLVAACQPAENQNKNANTNGNANANANANANRNQGLLPPISPSDKTVQIFVHDVKGNPGYYSIEDTGDVTLSVEMKQRVIWCVSYDGVDPSLRPDEVVIDTFRTLLGPTVTNPFGNGSPSDNDFHVPAVEINNCPMTPHSPKTGVVLASYKYTITAKVGGVDRGRLDPRVIINQ